MGLESQEMLLLWDPEEEEPLLRVSQNLGLEKEGLTQSPKALSDDSVWDWNLHKKHGEMTGS